MASRKEALMNTVRQEVALASAQELMNVKALSWTFLKVELLSVLLFFRKLANGVLQNV
jgi:hypothetical protein